jgi:CBS domain-containing protein
MKVQDVMSREVLACGPDDDLGKAAMTMWNGDCGSLPVVWGGRLVGMVTDRDICMGLALADARPDQRRVREVMSKEVYSCIPDDDLGDALETMASRRVRRLPVVDADALVGIVSMNDIVVHAQDRGHPPMRQILGALRAICSPRSEPRPERATAGKTVAAS